MWIALQIIGVFIVFMAQVSNRYFGFSPYGVLIYSAIAVFLLSWILPMAYMIAPSFYKAYFLSIISLSIFGLFGSYIFFNEQINPINIFGVGLSIIGCLLINIKI